jgi:hypothetical protein
VCILKFEISEPKKERVRDAKTIVECSKRKEEFEKTKQD